jgi:hypothetical protein
MDDDGELHMPTQSRAHGTRCAMIAHAKLQLISTCSL